MTFYEVLDQVIALLQRHGRVTYRALKRQFDLDDTYLEDLKAELIQVHCHAGLGTLYTTAGHLEQARVELSAAIALSRAMEMTFWLPQTEAALAQVL